MKKTNPNPVGLPMAKDRRSTILNQAATVLSKHPGASMAVIAKEMGISRATLYRHFPSREELIRDIALEAIRVTDEATAHVGQDVTTWREAFFQTIEALIPFADRYHFLRIEPVAYEDEQVKEGMERQYAQLDDMARGARRDGEIDPDIPTSWVTIAFNSLIWGAYWAVHDGRLAPRDAAKMVMRVFWRGVRK